MAFFWILTAALIVCIAIYFIFMSSKFWRESLPVTTVDLRKVSYLSDLSEADLLKLLPLVHEIRVGKGAWIIREHEGGDALYYVVSGEVDILKRGSVDHILVQKVSSGEFIGEMALLCGTKRVASARAIEHCVLIKIGRGDFDEFISADSRIKDSVWNACDVHSIQLTMSDDERLRSIPMDARQDWLSKRVSTFHSTGESIPIVVPGYVCLVAGSVQIGGSSYTRPAMLRVSPGQVIKFTAEGRLSTLPIC